MGYISDGATIWREHCSTADKLTGLNKLEGMYSESVSYIDAILHAERYYDKTETAARYFTSANDGTGSNLVCQTLDGYTAQQIIDAGTPSGCIAWWSGSEASIPAGWLLCNGSNGTPNLRDRFVVGAGGNYAKGTSGGSSTVTTSATITIAGHALTAAEMPLHTHGSITDYYRYWVSTPGVYNSPGGSSGSMPRGIQSAPPGAASEHASHTGYTDSGTAHDHAATWDGTDDQNKLPPWYALCAIMKS
jgi:hypothetical protein